MSTSDRLREAAAILRTALDPESTPHSRYQSLMLDIDWPALLAGAFEAEARVLEAGNPELIQPATVLVADAIRAVWAKLGVVHGR